MENQNNNLQELEGLRQQVAEFKNRMEQQEIVSKRLLNAAMNGHVSWIRTMNIWVGPIGLVLLLLIIYHLRTTSWSWGPMIFLLLVLIAETVFNLWNVSTIRDKHLAAHDVISVQQRLIAYKRREKLQVFGEFPFILLWLVWFVYDIHNVTNTPLSWLIPRVVIGLLIGSLIGFFMFYREMRSLNMAIKEIDEFADKV